MKSAVADLMAVLKYGYASALAERMAQQQAIVQQMNADLFNDGRGGFTVPVHPSPGSALKAISDRIRREHGLL